MAGSRRTPAEAPFEPLPERIVSDVETLKAISDPVRLRILEAMVSRHAEAWTVKRLAAALGIGQTKLYHHINVLEERGLIRVAGTRVVSGIIETSYQVAQVSVRLDRGLLAGGTVPGPVDELLRSVFDGVREAIEASLRAGVADPDPDADAPRRLMLARGLVRVPADRVGELHARLAAVVEEFDAMPETVDALTFGYLLGLYPIDSRVADTDDES